MLEHAYQLCAKEDFLAAIEFLGTRGPDVAVLKAAEQLVGKLYWEKKDLAAVVAISVFALSHGWKSAESSDETAPILGVVKVISYNLASFAWPGWDEPGIEIGRTDLSIGLAAAKTNLRLAEALEKGPLAKSRAHWMLGAHYLAQKEFVLASENFGRSVADASEADAGAEALLSEGFQVLAGWLENPRANPVALGQIDDIKKRLSPLEHGPGFAEQIEVAFRVFKPVSSVSLI